MNLNIVPFILCFLYGFESTCAITEEQADVSRTFSDAVCENSKLGESDCPEERSENIYSEKLNSQANGDTEEILNATIETFHRTLMLTDYPTRMSLHPGDPRQPPQQAPRQDVELKPWFQDTPSEKSRPNLDQAFSRRTLTCSPEGPSTSCCPVRVTAGIWERHLKQQAKQPNGDGWFEEDETSGPNSNANILLHSIDVLVFTVATNYTDGLQRYLNSAERYGIKPIILAKGEQWKGGAIKGPRGGWKVNLLKAALEQYKDQPEKIVLFTDAYDVLFLGQLEEIVRRFKATGAKVLFGAETICWPNAELVSSYPEVEKGARFLNSGLFMGYLPEIGNILNRGSVKDGEDDQLFFTEAYLDKKFREFNAIQLDHISEIFQNMFGAVDSLEIKTVENKGAGPEAYYLKNTNTGSEPLIIHANGLSKTNMRPLTNYLPNGVWNSVDGCIACKENQINLEKLDQKQWPLVFLALFVELNTPFLDEFFQKVYRLEYPKDRIHLFLHNAMKYHSNQVNTFVEAYGADYLSVKQIKPEDGTIEWAARDLSVDQCLAKNCGFYFVVDSIAHLDNPFTLKLLIEQNRSLVAPMLVRPGKAWSNFWGALTKDGFYARSNDYMDIVHGIKRGLWNVPFINSAYLVNASILRQYDRAIISYSGRRHGIMDADMAFCLDLRYLDVFMYVSNRFEFGHLINADTYDVTRTEPDMYQIFENEQDWEQAFIHPEWADGMNPEEKNIQPCPDVYSFPIVTPKFCKSLVNLMESFGKWSSGKNEDERLEGGYEAVPTRYIYLNQVGWERHWLYFLQKYVRPLQEHVFIGYYHDPPKSLMNVVVRYRPDEQPLLRPHHDSSTYTINIALNEVGNDYEGGGYRFIRYNCSVTDTKMGWMLMHPGRLTHYHDGLSVTKGTSYIMVAFVDP